MDSQEIIFDHNNKAAVVELRPDERYKPICSHCGELADGIHSNHKRQLLDLSLAEHRIKIDYNYRKVKCSKCNSIAVEELEVCEPGGPRVTRRLATYIKELCKHMTVKQVADNLNLDWKTVKAIDKHVLEKEHGETDYNGLKYIAIDELSYGKYHKYITIVLDFLTGRIIWIGRDRRSSTLDRFFSKMPEDNRKQIEAVAIDMWDPFIASVKKWCPQAHIVFDLFHIISQYNAVIDAVRREETARASIQNKKIIKGSRYMLFKNEENLTVEQIPRLNELIETNKNISTVYILKDQLKDVFKQPSKKDIAKKLNIWCELALESGLEPLKKFVKTLKRYEHGLLNYADYPIHTGILEGTNNKLQEIKRRAFGFHDLEYFILKAKQAFP